MTNADSQPPLPRLSDRFLRLAHFKDEHRVTLWNLEEALGSDGDPLFIIFLCIPFLFPMPIPGISTAFGLAIILLAARTSFAGTWRLPNFLGSRALKGETVHKLGESGHRFVRRVEKFLQPRMKALTLGPGRILAGLAIISSAIALAMPIPPVIPFTNTLPALAVTFLAAAMLTRDGIAALLGHLLHVASWGYFLSVAGVAFAFLGEALAWFQGWNA
jgi:hypothetical protein